MRILIADDHSVVRRGLRHILLEEFQEAFIDEVPDAETMINKVMNDSYDIIISDLSMPGRSGLEAISQIREFNKEIPIIIMSIHPEDHYAIRVLKAGASAYISKDLATDQLVSAVHMALSGQKYVTSAIAEKLIQVSSKDSSKPLHDYLSDREFSVLKQLAVGKSISEIAQSLNLGLTTISTYRSRILTKMDMKSNADLTIYCKQQQLI